MILLSSKPIKHLQLDQREVGYKDAMLNQWYTADDWSLSHSSCVSGSDHLPICVCFVFNYLPFFDFRF